MENLDFCALFWPLVLLNFYKWLHANSSDISNFIRNLCIYIFDYTQKRSFGLFWDSFVTVILHAF